MRMIRCYNTLDEVYTTDKLRTETRYHVDIAKKTCQSGRLLVYHAAS
jgi:hypothetical protein